jgi:hypothetical protein
MATVHDKSKKGVRGSMAFWAEEEARDERQDNKRLKEDCAVRGSMEAPAAAVSAAAVPAAAVPAGVRLRRSQLKLQHKRKRLSAALAKHKGKGTAAEADILAKIRTINDEFKSLQADFVLRKQAVKAVRDGIEAPVPATAPVPAAAPVPADVLLHRSQCKLKHRLQDKRKRLYEALDKHKGTPAEADILDKIRAIDDKCKSLAADFVLRKQAAAAKATTAM